MAIFGSARDISMFRKINRELLGDVITQQLAVYKYALDKTKVNMYGEASVLRSIVIKAFNNVGPLNHLPPEASPYIFTLVLSKAYL